MPTKLSDPYTQSEQTCRFVSRIDQSDYDYLRRINPNPRAGIAQLTINTIFYKLIRECKKRKIESYTDYERYLTILDKLSFDASLDVQPAGGTPVAITHTKAPVTDDRRGTTRTDNPVESRSNIDANAKKQLKSRNRHPRRDNVKPETAESGSETSSDK